MGYCAYDCGDSEHTCTVWDGKGHSLRFVNGEQLPNNNLAECPKDITTCDYRKKKVPSQSMKGGK